MLSIVKDSVLFDLDESVALPEDLVEMSVEGDRAVFVSPGKATYFIADGLGIRFANALRRGETVRHAIEFAASGGDYYKAEKSARAVLTEIEKYQCYQSASASARSEVVDLYCYLTKRCTLQCRHCYASAGPSRVNAGELSTAEWVQVFSQYHDAAVRRSAGRGKVTFSGGEATIRKDLFELASAVHSLGDDVHLFTNGTTIDCPESATKIARHFDSVQISLDGATEQVNDEIRGKGSFRLIMHALELMAETDARVAVALTVMPANHADIRDNIGNLLSPFGSRFSVRIGRVSLHGRANGSHIFPDVFTGHESLDAIMSQLFDLGLWKPREYYPGIKLQGCGYGLSIVVGETGDAFGCAMEKYPVGNLRRSPFPDLIERVTQLATETGADRIEPCRDCELRYLCPGPCRIDNVVRTGELTKGHCDSRYRNIMLQRLVAKHLDPYRLTARTTSSRSAPTMATSVIT